MKKQVIHPQALNFWVELSWQYARGFLWPEGYLTGTGIEIAKSYITQYYRRISAEHFVQLAPLYFARFKKKILYAWLYGSPIQETPSTWFSPQSFTGFRTINLASMPHHYSLN